MFVVVEDYYPPLVAAKTTAFGRVIFHNLCLPALNSVEQMGESNSSDVDCKLSWPFMTFIIFCVWYSLRLFCFVVYRS